MTTWGKRWLGVALFTAAIAVAAEVRPLLERDRTPPAEFGGWKLAAPPVCGKAIPADAQGWRGVAGGRRVCRAEYAGSPAVRVTFFDLPGYPVGPGAFDAWQKWPPNQPGKIGFFAGRFFGVAESPGADRAALDRFAVAFVKALTGAEPGGRW
jgi:hypothetical protein